MVLDQSKVTFISTIKYLVIRKILIPLHGQQKCNVFSHKEISLKYPIYLFLKLSYYVPYIVINLSDSL